MPNDQHDQPFAGYFSQSSQESGYIKIPKPPKIYWGFYSFHKQKLHRVVPFGISSGSSGFAMARHILMISEGAGVVNDHGLAIARNLRGEPQTCGKIPMWIDPRPNRRIAESQNHIPKKGSEFLQCGPPSYKLEKINPINYSYKML